MIQVLYHQSRCRLHVSRAEALNRLYKTDEALPFHPVWFTKHHLVCLPLAKAMARVIGAERDLIGGGVWTSTQLADLQSINNILTITAQIVKGGKSKIHLRPSPMLRRFWYLAEML